MTTPVIDFEARRQELRTLIGAKRTAYEELVLAAYTDPSQKPAVAQLRRELDEMEAELEEVTTAERARDRKWRQSQAAEEAQRRAAAIRAAQTTAEEVFDRAAEIGQEIQDRLESLRDLAAEVRALESRWRGTVWPLLGELQRTRGALLNVTLVGREIHRLDAALNDALLPLQPQGFGFAYGDRVRGNAASARTHVREALEQLATAEGLT